MVKKKSSKLLKSKTKTHFLIWLLLVIIAGLVVGGTVNFHIVVEQGKYDATIEYSQEESPALFEDDQGELYEDTTIPTVEEVDGGMFEDAYTGISSALTTDVYNDLGWSETYNVSSPEAFKNDTLGKCIIANNIYGAQCVSLARVFWWSYANRDVSTCGTGMAKGMMNCADQNAGNDFDVYWKDSAGSIQAGDWLVFDGGQYGHICMSMGPYNNGYVACLGENQGSVTCEGGGSATNIININLKNLIGFYRPKAYIKPAPEPTPQPVGETYIVVKGDTLGGIARELGWYTGEKLFGDNGYAQKLAEYNGITNRGLIFPGQVIKRLK